MDKLAAANLALENLEKFEAIAENTLRKYGYVPDCRSRNSYNFRESTTGWQKTICTTRT
jgi:hypothetical protein